ncbi:hypothetical protein [Streptomyces violascens]|uniref:hypothetical protein n=1 Tax=Streptomyces violascens TaxID=67381 RepID=UPI003688CB46
MTFRAPQDPAHIAEIDLRYKYFAVNVEMTVDGTEIISKRRFVTLMDLALSFAHVRKRIASAEDAAFGFTETEEVIHLRCDGDQVAMSSSKHPWQVSADREELLDAIAAFLSDANSCLIAEFPRLGENPALRNISRG